MARVFWDHSLGQHTAKWTVPPVLATSGSPVNDSPIIVQAGFGEKYRIFPSNYTEQYWGVYVKLGAVVAQDWFGLRPAAGSTLASIGLNASSQLALKIGGTTVVTGSYVFATGIWINLQFHYKLADSGGAWEARVNGVDDALFSGDTKPGADTSFNTFSIFSISGAAMSYWAFVCDDAVWPGQQKFARRLPTGDSATNNAWTASTGSNKWANVDDVPPDDDTTYNFSGTNGQRQGHTHANHTLPATATVVAVITELMAKGDVSLKAGVRSSTSEAYSAAQGLNSGSYGIVEHRQTTNPNGGAAWALGDLNASETIYETVI